MARTPKGTYARNTPDWFVDRLCFGSGQVNGGGGGAGLSIQLFNNTDIGEYLFLYGLWVNDFNNEQLFAQVNAGPIGSPFQNCYSVVGGRPTPAGVVYTGATPAGADLIHQPLTWQGNQPSAPILPSFPLAVIPPGYGFLIYNGFSSAAIIASFWYVRLLDQLA